MHSYTLSDVFGLSFEYVCMYMAKYIFAYTLRILIGEQTHAFGANVVRLPILLLCAKLVESFSSSRQCQPKSFETVCS